MSRVYNKPPLSIPEQVEYLLDKGFICDDKERLGRYLGSIGYYRLSIYWHPYLSRHTRKFHPDTHFDSVLSLYIFDRKLRLLVMEAIERIEVALRAQWSGMLSLHGGSHAYMNAPLFKCTRKHIQDIAKIDRQFENSKEIFIQHYKDTYCFPQLPPIWAIVETMTLGMLSRWLENTKDVETKKAIMKQFNLPTIDILEGIFHALTPVRNVCAHHGRLWNRCFAKSQPKIKRLGNSLVPKDSPHKQDYYLYNHLVVIEHLMRSINPNSEWKKRLMALIEESNPPVQSMGFPANWKQLKPWCN